MKVVSRSHEAISDGQTGSMVLWKQEKIEMVLFV